MQERDLIFFESEKPRIVEHIHTHTYLHTYTHIHTFIHIHTHIYTLSLTMWPWTNSFTSQGLVSLLVKGIIYQSHGTVSKTVKSHPVGRSWKDPKELLNGSKASMPPRVPNRGIQKEVVGCCCARRRTGFLRVERYPWSLGR